MLSEKNNPAVASRVKGDRRFNGNQSNVIITASSDSVNPSLQKALIDLQREAENLSFGILTLQIHFKEGLPYRYTISKEKSFLCEGGERCPS